MRLRHLLVVVLLLLTAACGESRSGPLVIDDPDASSFSYDYRIPAGTGDRFDRGEYVGTAGDGEFVKRGPYGGLYANSARRADSAGRNRNHPGRIFCWYAANLRFLRALRQPD